jgi:hypothetical protein
MGPATVDPSPPPSTKTVKTMLGFFKGAKTVNQAWVLVISTPISAVPVLQATSGLKSKNGQPVPPSLQACFFDQYLICCKTAPKTILNVVDRT